MASGKEYLHFILEQLSDLDDISYRPMMGEFILYYRGKIVGGIYDDRLLVKKTRSALELMPAAICELPYEGAKEMLLVDEVDSKVFLAELFEAMFDELPSPKRKDNDIGGITDELYSDHSGRHIRLRDQSPVPRVQEVAKELGAFRRKADYTYETAIGRPFVNFTPDGLTSATY